MDTKEVMRSLRRVMGTAPVDMIEALQREVASVVVVVNATTHYDSASRTGITQVAIRAIQQAEKRVGKSIPNADLLVSLLSMAIEDSLSDDCQSPTLAPRAEMRYNGSTELISRDSVGSQCRRRK